MHNFSAGLYVDHHIPSSRYFYHEIKQTITSKYILKIDSDKPRSIYGVGICVKSKKYPTTIELDITAERTTKDKLTRPLIAPMKRTVTAKAAVIHVEELLFKKLAIQKDNLSSCTIQVQMTQRHPAMLYYYKSFEPEHPEVGLRFATSTLMDSSLYTGTSCVAYVLYDDRKV